MRTAAVARYVLAILVRNRLFALAAGFGVFLLAISLGLSELTPGSERRTFFDAAYLGLEALAVFVPLAATVVLHGLEHEQRTLWLVLSRPVSRSAYAWGRGAGVAGAAWCALAVVGGAVVALAWSMRALPETFLVPVLASAALEAVLVTALACLASATATAPVTAFVMGGGAVVLGYLSGILPQLARQSTVPAARAVLRAAWWLLPHLGDFAVRDFTEPAEAWYLAQLGIYAAAYAGLVMLAAGTVFRAREL